MPETLALEDKFQDATQPATDWRFAMRPHDHHAPTLLSFAVLAMIAVTGAHAAPASEAMSEYRNLTYQGIYDYPVTLHDGVYEGEPFVPGGASRPRVQLVEDIHARGDLDGDGLDEAVVLLAESSGGTGVMTFMALMTWHDGAPENRDTVLLGDRVQIRSLGLDQGELVLELIKAGAQDAACCPTRKTRTIYRLQQGQLVQTSSEDQGSLSLRDLEGVAWRLTHLDHRTQVPEGVLVTLTVDGDKISGSAGCNRYFGSVADTGPRDLAIGPLGSTRMACPEPKMDTERRYLGALENVRQFSFLNGRPALSYDLGEEKGIDLLLFAPAP